MILLNCLIVHLFECLADMAQIKAAGPNAEAYWVRRWHKYDTLQWGVIYVSAAMWGAHPIIMVHGLVVRLFMLQIVLNKLRGLSIHHLGKNPVDRFFHFVFGKKTAFVKFILLLAALAAEIYFVK